MTVDAVILIAQSHNKMQIYYQCLYVSGVGAGSRQDIKGAVAEARLASALEGERKEQEKNEQGHVSLYVITM